MVCLIRFLSIRDQFSVPFWQSEGSGEGLGALDGGLEPQDGLLRRLSGVWGALGTNLGGSWAPSGALRGPSWGLWGASWVVLRPSWRSSGRFLRAKCTLGRLFMQKCTTCEKYRKNNVFFVLLRAQRGLGWPKLGSEWGTLGLSWLKLANMMGKMKEDAKVMRVMLPKLGSGCRPRASWRPSWSEMMR